MSKRFTVPPYQAPAGTMGNHAEPVTGAVIVTSDPAPQRAVTLQHHAYQLPPGFTDSPSAARMLGLTESSLRIYRSRKPGEDRGPTWHTVNGWRVCYRVADVQAYVAARASELRVRADAIEARAAAGTLSAEDAKTLAEITGATPRE